MHKRFRNLGCNRDGERLPQINFACYLSEDTGLPAFYVAYNGSVVDKSHLPRMMSCNEELAIKEVGFVMDKGFCSTANIQFLAEGGWPFIMAVEGFHKTTRGAIDQVRDGVLSFRNAIDGGQLHAMAVRGRYYGVDSTMHVYFNPATALHHRRDLIRLVEDKEAALAQKGMLDKSEARRHKTHFDIDLRPDGTFTFKRNYDKIDHASRNFGFLCVLTNTGLDSAEVMRRYRRKDVIEKCYDDLRNHIDMDRLRVHNERTMSGKMFCAFTALIVVSHMQPKFRLLFNTYTICPHSLSPSQLPQVKLI